MRKKKTGATHVTTASSSQLQGNVWKVRKVGLGLMMSIKGDHKPIPFIEDAAVPPEHLAEYVTKVEEFCNSLGNDVAYYAHASAGCIHIRPLMNTKAANEVAKLPEIVRFSVDLLRGYGGSFSSEHGDGRARSWLNEYFFGPDLFGLYRQVKRTFDPDNLLNPGNIVERDTMTENLRFGENYQVIKVSPHIDFSSEQGFDRAVEMCNGAGVCRKRTGDTMCPSFMVTREEEHSTRGRANALRAAMSGRMPTREFTSQRMYEVMDLCVECKACKAECPSSVDMAKIKFEFLAQYYEENGVPARTRLFANIGNLNQRGSGSLSSAANWAVKNGLLRGAAQRTLGITTKRSMPPFARQSFTSWFKARQVPAGDYPMGKLALFFDPFTNHNYPKVAIAATELFEAAGFQVVLPDLNNDARPYISKGLVKEARAIARDTVDCLAEYAEQGIPIVGLEPSSLLSLRDEFLYLLPVDPLVRQVAENAFTFEEFIDKLASEEQLRLTFTETPRKILLHGHCHQKSLVGMEPSKRILGLPPNYTVEEVDSGCCGMAGSFGYEAEHYEISMQMAERRLLPAVRSAETDTLIAAAGISCRQQIQHGSERQALHPAEVLREALV
jgi:Fe-S oxidoreductase